MDAKTVKEFFNNLDDEKSQLVADLVNNKIKIDAPNFDEQFPQFPKTERWIRQCHHYPGQHDLVMSILNEILEGHGSETIKNPDDSDDIIAEYVNMGDTYNATIVFDTKDQTGEYNEQHF